MSQQQCQAGVTRTHLTLESINRPQTETNKYRYHATVSHIA